MAATAKLCANIDFLTPLAASRAFQAHYTTTCQRHVLCHAEDDEMGTKKRLFGFVATIVFLAAPTIVFAQCRATDASGKSTLLGQFPFEKAYQSCINVYKNRYLKQHDDSDSELWLQCRGGRQSIAYFSKGRFYETGLKVAGCALSKTMG
jgi:hypothetical protein